MSGFAPRVTVATAAWAAGTLLGFVLGAFNEFPLIGALVGGMVGAVSIVAIDARRGRRLLMWLRQSQQGVAPRDTGFWGEVGYRIEKSLRAKDLAFEVEAKRREQFLSAMEASPNGVLMLDADEQIDWCNTMAADHFAINPARDLGQRITNLVRSPAFKSYLRTGDFDEPVVFKAPVGGTILSVLVRTYGEGLKLVLSQDITERERAEAMRRDFVANVSHEIRTPLTVLAGFVETLATLPLNGEERKRVLALMTQQTERMQVLVADLLILAQLEGSPRPEADSWVSLADLLKHAERDALALSNERHTIQFESAAGVEVAGSETELASAIGNLLTNAVRYTPAGGRIDVRWAMRPDGGGTLSVRDTGPGIAREHLPRLTERFYRVDGSRSRDTGGTGLGLSIVKHVMQRHGGNVDVQSELGRGSVFRLELPAARLRQRATDVSAKSAATQT